MIKRCSKFGEIKTLSLFRCNKKTSDGKTSYCKACLSLQAKAWRIKNRERISERKKEIYQQNREEINAKCREYYQKNTEKVNACNERSRIKRMILNRDRRNAEKIFLWTNKIKYCSRCKVLKSFSCFSRDKTKNDGFYTICKECSKVHKSEYYYKNKEVLSIKQKEYQKLKPRNTYLKEYYLKNRKYFLEKSKDYAQRNNDKIKQYRKQYADIANDAYTVGVMVENTKISKEIIKKFPSLIEAKRLQIKLKRLLKTL